jgi:beta-lactam-binding protein with PASTA domain
MADRVVEIKDYSTYTKAQLKELLNEKGVTYNDKDNKTTLLELLK